MPKPVERNATYVQRCGTLLDTGVNSLNSTRHVRTVLLMYPSRLPFSFQTTTGRARPSSPALSTASFLPSCSSLPLFSLERPTEHESTAYLNFRSKGNTRRMPRSIVADGPVLISMRERKRERERERERETGHPVNGTPARTIFKHVRQSFKNGMYKLVIGKREYP